MKTYNVTLPVSGSINVLVTVEDDASEEDILSAAYDTQDWNVTGSESTEPGEFETLNHICTGNVCHALVWDFDIEEEK